MTVAPGSRRQLRGVTLLKLVLALAALAFGLLTVATAQIRAMRGDRSGRQTTQAAVIAEHQMADMRRWRWDDPSLAPTNWTPLATVGDGIERGYGVQWRIVDVVPGRRRAIDVRVVWSEPEHPERSYTISSVRYNQDRL